MISIFEKNIYLTFHKNSIILIIIIIFFFRCKLFQFCFYLKHEK